jgi:hypothetical protein
MRWRTEQEVKDGKGERVCAGLGCGRVTEEEREVLFNYEEHGEGKEAMVKVRLCAGCARRLRKARGDEKERSRRRSRSRSPRRRHRERSRSRERRKRDHRYEKDDSEGKYRSRRRSRSRSPRRQRERSTERSKRDDQKEDRTEEKSMPSERERGDDKEVLNDERGDRGSCHRTDEKSESTKYDGRPSGAPDRSGSPSRTETRRKPREKAWA